MALVPAELSLDCTDIEDRRLDLDHQQEAGSALEGEEVDPAMRPTVDDLDLPPTVEAERLETTMHIGGTASVREVTLRWIDDDRAPGVEAQLHAQGCCESIHDIEGRIGAPGFDVSEVGSRDPRGAGQLILGDVEVQAHRSAEIGKRWSEAWRQHRPIEAGDA